VFFGEVVIVWLLLNESVNFVLEYFVDFNQCTYIYIIFDNECHDFRKFKVILIFFILINEKRLQKVFNLFILYLGIPILGADHNLAQQQVKTSVEVFLCQHDLFEIQDRTEVEQLLLDFETMPLH